MFFKRKLQQKKDIFTEIFEKVYSKLECKLIYVFLCGGACESGSEQIRDDIRNIIEKKFPQIKILYPEHLFFEKDSTQLVEFYREKDLLELETVLAHNSNVVCIICESMGSATELGAFTNYEGKTSGEILNKLVAVTYQKYANKPSFISEGPIKRIIKKDASKFKLYEYKKFMRKHKLPEKKEKLAHELAQEFEKICKKNIKTSKNRIFLQEGMGINNFIGLSYLILLYIYFYKETSSKYIKPLFNENFQRLQIGTRQQFEFYYPMAIRFLLNNQKYIAKNDKDNFELTEKGLKYIKNDLLNILNIDKKDLDYIRLRILQMQLYDNK